MFGLGGQELLLILLIILLFFGPSKLPELARSFGKGMREFRKAQEELEREINKAVETPEPYQKSNPASAAATKPDAKDVASTETVNDRS